MPLLLNRCRPEPPITDYLFCRVNTTAEDDLPTIMNGRIPWVLSKWHEYDGEWMHRYNDIPWRWKGVIIQFVTDRP